jgi:hypothetical protein
VNWTVNWTDAAHVEMLAQLLRSADKQQMLRAGRTLENSLRADPYTVGESRDDGERVVFARPLLFAFRIDDDTRTVFIGRVKWVGL